MKVAVTGATGFVGQQLVGKLADRGDGVVVLSRNGDRARRVFPTSAFPTVEIVDYTPKAAGSWQGAISGCDGVVNLAGAPLAEHRWTDAYKQEILESRQIGTQNIVEAIAKAENKPKVLVNASAVGYYGTSETETFDETSPSGDDFLARVCQAWETEARKVEEMGTRSTILRFGIIVGPGGAIEKMLLPFRLFAGGPLGSGRQWFSWVDREDVTDLILASLDRDDLQGVYNATSPNPIRMDDLCHTLGDVLSRPSWLPVPDVALEMMLGEGAMVVLEGQKVLPQRTQAAGYQYRYPQLKPALQKAVNEV